MSPPEPGLCQRPQGRGEGVEKGEHSCWLHGTHIAVVVESSLPERNKYLPHWISLCAA